MVLLGASRLGAGGRATRGAPPLPGSAQGHRLCAREPLARSAASRLADDDGSQTLELALLLPLVAFIMIAVLHAGLAASELVLAQAAARDAARVAAVDDDRAAVEAAEAVAGRRDIVVDISPPASARRGGDLVTVAVRLRSAVLQRIGVEAWFPARTTMPVEGM